MGWKNVGDKAYYGPQSIRAPGLDDKAGWVKQIAVGHLPPRFQKTSRDRPRKLAYVFIHYPGKPPP